MKTKEAVIRLKQAGVRNCEIATLLNISKQYVSRVCQLSQDRREQAKTVARDGLITVGGASRLLGLKETTIRRWSDGGKIRSFRIEGGRRDRKFRLPDLWQLMKDIEVGKDRALE